MVYALILSGGVGTRIGSSVPKQYIEVKGRPVISWCMETLLKSHGIAGIQIVADPAWRDYLNRETEKLCQKTHEESSKFKGFSDPGENRQLSILNGLRDIDKYGASDDYVLIHDAARPCLSDETVTSLIEGAIHHDGAIPVLPMKDTVYLTDGEKRISSLLERDLVVAGQAPEIFLLGKYLIATEALLPDKIMEIHGSTEPAIMAGMDIITLEGDERNIKITTSEDLDRFIRLIL